MFKVTGNQLSVYPNPSDGEFTVYGLQSAVEITVYSMVGEKVYSSRLPVLTVFNCFGQMVKQMENLSGQEIILQRDDLPSGLYFIRLTEENKIYTGKLIITDK